VDTNEERGLEFVAHPSPIHHTLSSSLTLTTNLLPLHHIQYRYKSVEHVNRNLLNRNNREG